MYQIKSVKSAKTAKNSKTILPMLPSYQKGYLKSLNAVFDKIFLGKIGKMHLTKKIKMAT